ncbi:transcriptional regulator [Luteimicrobium album]|uniref:Transcriptional regulator n=2 Tax=Luteimicrobium album TaxID=1054550 RepID=A0ABQ6I641_9MICO|nr:transcriptional regulator [Luteimicrobium album]
MEPSGRVSREILAVLQALADPVRVEMVRRLRSAGESQSCGVLHDDLPRSTASYHFRVLRESGVIEQYDRSGRRLNRLREQHVQELAPGLLDAVFAAPSQRERGADDRP